MVKVAAVAVWIFGSGLRLEGNDLDKTLRLLQYHLQLARESTVIPPALPSGSPGLHQRNADQALTS